MSTIELAREPELKPTTDRAIPRPVVGLLGLLTIACVPPLIWHAVHLWTRPHYQFFPMVPVAAALLAGRALRNLGQLQAGDPQRVWRLIAVGALALFVGGLLHSPYVAAIATLSLLAVAVYAVGGLGLCRRLLPAWGILWLAIPPPFSLDQKLVTALQTLATRCTDHVLDVFRILHTRAGTVIELPAKRLLVEEACSGVQSLSAILACTVFFLLWKRMPLVRSLLLLAAALAWVVLANIARLVIVSVLLGRWQIDVSFGWKHEVLGWVLFTLALFLTWSTDQLLEFFRQVIPWRRKKGVEIVGLTDPTARPRRNPTRLPDLSGLAPKSWRPAVAFSLLALFQVAWFWPRTYAEFSGDRLMNHLAALDQNTFPSQIGPWKLQTFEALKRERNHWQGEYNRMWNYQAGRLTATIAVDYPFNGWHELTECYQAQDWVPIKRQVLAADSHVVVAQYRKPLDRLGYLWFSLRDEEERPLSPAPLTSQWRKVAASRLQAALPPWLHRRLVAEGSNELPAYQVQLLIDTYTPLSPEELEQAQALFLHAFRTLGNRQPGPQR